MRTFLRLSVTVLIFIFSASDSFSQCTSGGTNSGTITPTTSWQTLTVQGGKYWTFTAATCNNYVFSFCSNGGSSSWDTQITICDNSGTPVAGGYNDDYCSLQSQLTWTPAAGGTYRVYITQFSCVSNATNATLAYEYTPGNTIAGNFSLVGSATSPSPFTCAVLTTTSGNQLGCAWANNTTLNFASNFTYDFTINMGSDPNGADGMAFVVQNDPRGKCACGTAGQNLGADGIQKSIIVEIDTYLNAEDRDDGMPAVLCSGGPNPDHLDIWLNGIVNPAGTGCPTPAGARIIPNAVQLMNGASLYTIKNGLDHILRVIWTAGSPGTLTASLMNSSLTTTYGTVSYSFTALTLFGTNTPFFGFTASTGLFTNQQSFCLPPTLIPIDLISFTAQCRNGRKELNWTTATETNNNFFTIEGSGDGVHFKALGVVRGVGNSPQVHHYSWTDNAASPGGSYYRLRQTDQDGRSSLSPQVAVRSCSSNSNAITIYPNPFSDHITLIPQSASGQKILLTIYNAIGEKVIELPTTMHEQKLDLRGLAKGGYLIKITGDNISFYSKLIKQ